jgi:hypothetical protein
LLFNVKDSANDAEQQRALLVRLMQMTPEQIDLLPPDQRVQVMQLVI